MSKKTLACLYGKAFCCVIAALAASQSAYAQDDIGRPTPGGIGLPAMATPAGHETQAFYNDVLLPIITLIPIFVLGLLIYVMWRFNEKANPVASKYSHNHLLEIVWTAIPCLILIGIAFPSMHLLTTQVVVPEPSVTIKVTGNQWYWKYDYPKEQGGGFSFEQRGKPDSDLQPGELRMLAVDNEAVVPVNEVVKVQVTSSDVIHAFGIPSFAVRMDAIPGRLNETWFKIDKPGVYYGECYFICGKDHAYMPIAIRAVSRPEYEKWLAEAKEKFASGDGAGATARVAVNP
ncbi:cytochrome c oxidase subunit II [Methylocystis bryophila]|uniref:Cytochrome c oxidase subunit 2 n=1 Tax=Methylocystis bryophila TaxID=655015 RepID=A0A1W6MYY1_9HYPH|nr:cytochrome c oxidase subunit II [Methylocystis bryophila]ARN82794.1 cytochrome c oxidase subunit II [Methylocystis bryophila]BDV39039.1 cytochrome c oxidase subunit 2 [Methylocystis bryophila]